MGSDSPEVLQDPHSSSSGELVQGAHLLTRTAVPPASRAGGTVNVPTCAPAKDTSPQTWGTSSPQVRWAEVLDALSPGHRPAGAPWGHKRLQAEPANTAASLKNAIAHVSY